MRRLIPVLALALLAGCHHAPSSLPTARDSASLAALNEPDPQALKLHPDQALEKATKKAVEWQPDVRLIGVGWGVAKFQTTSIVWHTFYSKKANKIFIVESKLTTFFQKTRELSGHKFTIPARLMGTVPTVKVSGPEALEIARKHLPPDDKRPIAGLALIKPNRFAPPIWLIKAGDLKCVVHADSGKVLLKTDYDVPFMPFAEAEPAAEAPFAAQ